MDNEMTADEIKFIDEQDLKNRFPEECKRLPIDYLEENERELVEKCINKEQFTEDELNNLKKLLADYRPFLKRYDAVKIKENIEDNVTIIKSSKELLQLLDDPDRYRFDMHYKIKGQLLRLQFQITPVSDHEYTELLDYHARIFKNLDAEEKRIYAKLANEEKLTPEEQKLINHIQDKIIEIFGDVDKNNDKILNFLINHVELIMDNDLSITEREHFWKEMDLGSRALIYEKCKTILQIDHDLEVELFPAIR